MEFDDIHSIERISPSAEERLKNLKELFHGQMIEDSTVVAIVSKRLDDESKDVEGAHPLGAIQLEPIYYKDRNGRYVYGISLTRLVPFNLGGSQNILEQPDPLELGSPNEATGGFSLSPRFEDLLRRTGKYDDASILGLLRTWQGAMSIFDRSVGADAAPDPSFYGTYRLTDELQDISDFPDMAD